MTESSPADSQLVPCPLTSRQGVLHPDERRLFRSSDPPVAAAKADDLDWAVINDRLIALGIVLPPVRPPIANYRSCVVDQDVVYVSGHGPIVDGRAIAGKVGLDLTLGDAKNAARVTAINILASLQDQIGDLDRIERILKVFGMVNAAPGFNQMPAVIDGCSDLLVEVFGEPGRHARSAIGVAELPSDIAVEIELIAKLKPGPTVFIPA